jgi:hypothetical protein
VQHHGRPARSPAHACGRSGLAQNFLQVAECRAYETASLPTPSDRPKPSSKKRPAKEEDERAFEAHHGYLRWLLDQHDWASRNPIIGMGKEQR